MEDSEIIELFIKREEKALIYVEEKYASRLYQTAFRVLYDPEDAKECVNDALLKAWDVIPPHCPKFLGAFIAKITRNIAINKYKAGQTIKRGGGHFGPVVDELEQLASTDKTPEQAFESETTLSAINTFLARLDKKARLIFVKRYFYGLSIDDIATQLKLTDSNVKSSLFRTRKKLKTYLEKEGVTI